MCFYFISEILCINNTSNNQLIDKIFFIKAKIIINYERYIKIINSIKSISLKYKITTLLFYRYYNFKFAFSAIFINH